MAAGLVGMITACCSSSTAAETHPLSYAEQKTGVSQTHTKLLTKIGLSAGA